MTEQLYVHSQNPEEFENGRLTLLETGLNPMTIRHIEDLGIAGGWNCLEVGAGRGSVAVWLAKQVGSRGKVLATDIDIKFMRDLNIPNLDVRQHDLLKDDLEENQYNLVHCRALLLHLAQPEKSPGKNGQDKEARRLALHRRTRL
jgi:2-polyprenyl-3-methyl-5-hydroxy-6-metoxy-1,4-benzoquinol methylase